MKKIIFFVFATCIGCKKLNTVKAVMPASEAIFFITDVTNNHNLKSTAFEALQEFKLEQNPNSEVWFRLSAITDKKINKTYYQYLPNDSTTEVKNIQDDPQFRAKTVQKFYQSVKESYGEFYSDFDTSKNLGFSECWASIAEAVNSLEKTKAQSKVLYIYSDLAEHTNSINVYSTRFNEDKLEEAFLKASSIPKHLESFKIVITNIPVTRSDDKRFCKLMSVYNHIFSCRGASVTLNTSSQIIEL